MTLQEILGNELPRWAQISKDDPVIFTRLAPVSYTHLKLPTIPLGEI